ncbi:uncharacterized protein LOC132196386 [Neocloeon triangulifer]|uniref:uncharacterized protein LOC132196386 n=1 Tax=Neocloeon triangulifer TaxID=2078957 RepID=UPI00286F85B7|nr:uncharacterized protein LOC132196386 [Neocloeon triangulifer]
MNTATLKNAALFSTFFFFFSAGVEYGVFLPNAVEYLHSIGVQREAVLGVVLACYWFGCCVSTKVLLWLLDSNYQLRPLLFACCVLYLASGLMYLFAPSLWAIIFSKFFSGLGAGSLFAIKKDLSGSTGADEFAVLQKWLHLSVALGWLVSPVFGLLSDLATRSTASSNEAAVVTCALFVLCAVLTLLGFTHLARNLRLCRLRDTLALAYEKKQPHNNKSYGSIRPNDSGDLLSFDGDQSTESCSIIFARDDLSTPVSALRSSSVISLQHKQAAASQSRRPKQTDLLTESDELLETAEDFMGTESRLPLRISQITLADSKNNLCSPSVSTPGNPLNETDCETAPDFSRIANKKPVSSLCAKNHTNWLCPQLLTAFLFGSLQAMLTPLTEYYFLFGTMENSVAQLLVSTFGLLPSLVIPKNSNYLRFFTVLGCVVGIFATAGLLIIGPGTMDNIVNFASCILTLAVSCGILFATCGPKIRQQYLLTEEQEGWLWCLGLVIGPLWTGSTVGQPKVMHCGHLIVLILGLASCLF